MVRPHLPSLQDSVRMLLTGRWGLREGEEGGGGRAWRRRSLGGMLTAVAYEMGAVSWCKGEEEDEEDGEGEGKGEGGWD